MLGMVKKVLPNGQLIYYVKDASMETRLELAKWIIEDVSEDLSDAEDHMMTANQEEVRRGIADDLSSISEEFDRLNSWLDKQDKEKLKFFSIEDKEEQKDERPDSERGLEYRYMVLKFKDPFAQCDSIVMEFNDPIARKAILHWAELILEKDGNRQLFKDIQEKCWQYETGVKK